MNIGHWPTLFPTIPIIDRWIYFPDSFSHKLLCSFTFLLRLDKDDIFCPNPETIFSTPVWDQLVSHLIGNCTLIFEIDWFLGEWVGFSSIDCIYRALRACCNDIILSPCAFFKSNYITDQSNLRPVGLAPSCPFVGKQLCPGFWI